MALQVIGAGFGRTGTTSLKLALEKLGFNRCYHMLEVPGHQNGAESWIKAADNETVDWDIVLNDFQAVVDWPACAFYQLFHRTYPHAKVILTVRDADKWYESASETIYPFSHVIPRWIFLFSKKLKTIHMMIEKIIWQGTFHDRFLEPHYAKKIFNEHIEKVKNSIPAEQLLIFDVSQGWQPLCEFLAVDVPTEPFPRVNDAAEMKQKIRLVKYTFTTLYGLIAIALIGVVYTLLF